MREIFVSYRRVDAQDATGRLCDRLRQRFGDDAVFLDVHSIGVGLDFAAEISQQLAQCRVFLAVIGTRWLEINDQHGRPRLQAAHDYVRMEIEAALRQGVFLVPVLVNDATMPAAERLPASIRDIAQRNAARVRPDPDFHADVDRLLQSIAPHLLLPPTAPEPLFGLGRDTRRALAAMGAALLAAFVTIGVVLLYEQTPLDATQNALLKRGAGGDTAGAEGGRRVDPPLDDDVSAGGASAGEGSSSAEAAGFGARMGIGGSSGGDHEARSSSSAPSDRVGTAAPGGRRRGSGERRVASAHGDAETTATPAVSTPPLSARREEPCGPCLKAVLERRFRDASSEFRSADKECQLMCRRRAAKVVGELVRELTANEQCAAARELQDSVEAFRLDTGTFRSVDGCRRKGH